MAVILPSQRGYIAAAQQHSTRPFKKRRSAEHPRTMETTSPRHRNPLFASQDHEQTGIRMISGREVFAAAVLCLMLVSVPLPKQADIITLQSEDGGLSGNTDEGYCDSSSDMGANVTVTNNSVFQNLPATTNAEMSPPSPPPTIVHQPP